MPQKTTTTTALTTVVDLAGKQIRTASELTERIRACQAEAHILSPTVAISSIPPTHAINVAVVVIDPAVDPQSGAGTDVYHQPSIHKRKKTGQDYEPVEVSLGKTGLQKIAHAAGINWIESRRIDDGRTPSYWSWTCIGQVIDFDGTPRRLPPGSVEIDLRDGSPQIGGWTPALWATAVQACEDRKATTAKADQWKVKPYAIGGWTADRVMGARRFGLRLAESKAMNAAIRNLGVKQKYTVDELRKPFVVFRCSFVPDMSDPEVKRIVTERALGGTAKLYAHAPASQGGDVIDVDAGQAAAVSPAPPPDDGLDSLPSADDEGVPATPVGHHITFVGTSQHGFVIRTTETGDRRLETTDRAIALAAKTAMDAQTVVELTVEQRNGGWVILEIAPWREPSGPVQQELKV